MICRFVCAMSSGNLGRCYRFRSYAARAHKTENCTIVAAARATTASPVLFKSIQIGSMEFVDSSLGCSNPIKEVLDEAQSLFGGDHSVSCVVSVGMGNSQARTLKGETYAARLNE